MNLDETMLAIKKAVEETLEECPTTFVDVEPEEGFRDMSCRLVANFAKHGLVLIERARFDAMSRDFAELKAAVENAG